MRKKLLWLSFSVWIMLFTASGCQKDEKTQAWGNRVVLSNTGSKESGPVLVFYGAYSIRPNKSAPPPLTCGTFPRACTCCA